MKKILCAAVLGASILAGQSFDGFLPGNLVVSRSVYTGDASTVTVGQKLPPVCPATAACGTATATNDGTYPNVFLNDKVDGSFGVTSPIFLDQISPEGARINTLALPVSQLVTSFSSKSELALNLSPDGTMLTFMGYVAPVNALDVSNSNTPGVVDPTNPVGTAFYRAVAQVYQSGALQITNTNAYCGNNGRAAILAGGYFYTVGNSNNGSGTPDDVVAAAGVQLVVPGKAAGAPQEIGDFSISQYDDPATGLPYAADKRGKDNNYRGLTIHGNSLYVSKGSGSNGMNTVYLVGNEGSLPVAANASSAPIAVLPGFPATLAKNADAAHPFGLFFADSKTLYVADEGDGTAANAAADPKAGLQKWSKVDGVWQLDYVLQNGLDLGKQYSIDKYPAALNPATDGLRNLTGRVNADGTVTIWAVTSTVSTNGDQGADPNKLVTVTDILANRDPAVAAEAKFTTVMAAGYGEVLRGVSFTPGTVSRRHGGR